MMRKLYCLLALFVGLNISASLSAQTAKGTTDTCFVALRIDNPAEPFAVKSASNGLLKKEGERNVLYTTSPFIKIVNESSDEVRDKNTHVYRMITFRKGEATTYDYTYHGGTGKGFRPVPVRNMKNFVYFRIDSARNATISFRLEGMESTERRINVRTADGTAPADVLAKFGIKAETPKDEVKPGEGEANATPEATVAANEEDKPRKNAMDERNSWVGPLKSVLIALLALAIAGIIIYYLIHEYRKRSRAKGEEPVDLGIGGNEPPTPETTVEIEDKVIGKQAEQPRKDAFVAAEPEEKPEPEKKVDPVVPKVAATTPQIKIVEKIVKVPVEKIVEKIVKVPVEKVVEVPVEKVVEKVVEVPVEKVVEKVVEVPVEKVVEVPVEKVVEKVVEVPVEKVVEKVVEVPVEKIVEKIVEVQVPVEKIVEVPVPAAHLGGNEMAPEIQRQVESLRTILQQKQQELQDKQQEVNNAKQIANAAVADAQKKASKQIEAATAEAQKKAADEIAAIKQEAEAQRQKTLAELDNLRQKASDGLAAAKAENESLRQKAANQLAAAKAENDSLVKRAAAELAAALQKAAGELALAKKQASEELSAVQLKATSDVNAAQRKADETVAEALSKANEAVAAAQKKAASEVAATKQNAEQQLAALRQQTNEEIETTKQNAQQAVSAAQKKSEEEIAAAHRKSTAAIAAAQQKASDEVAAAQRESADTIAAIQKKSEDDVKAAQQKAAETIAATQQKADADIAALRQQLADVQSELVQKSVEVDNAIALKTAELEIESEQKISSAVAAADLKAQNSIDAAAAEVAAAKEEVQRLEYQLQKPLQISRDGLQSSLALIQEHIMQMKEGVEAFNADNNYHNTTMHMAQKFTSFMNWFDRNILQGEAEEAREVDGLYNLMQDTFRRDLENTYSWIAELLRISSYSAISPLFLNEFKRSGIPIDSMKIATSETISLLGRYGISLIIPHLFVDDFERDNFKLNNAPLINSFYPKGFKEQMLAKRGVIYDMIRAGYAIGGQVQKVPEVSAMMAIAE